MPTMPNSSSTAVPALLALVGRSVAGRIVGGENALIRDHPYQVAWLFNNQLHCGAAIISADFLISAAHCFPFGNATQGSSFRVGSQVAVVGGQHVLPAAFYKHPRYNRLRAFEMDIGLIRLRWPLRFGRGVEPVPLVDTWAPRLQEDDQLIVTGWGLTKPRAEARVFGGSYLLQKIAISPVEHQLCVDIYRSVGLSITDSMLCAFSRNKDTCQGDSGGPIVVHSWWAPSPKLLGIVSWGIGCADPSFPGVYTDLRQPAVREYIQAVTGRSL